MRSGKKDILGRLDSDIIDTLIYNQTLNAFRISINKASGPPFNMQDGLVDEFEDESGIDTVNSTNKSYDSANDLYMPSGVDSYTKLLLHCNGTDGSTDFDDSGYTGHTVTVNGDTQIDTSQKKFGTGSALFDGTGDYLSIPDSSDWNFGTDAFTIDLWIYCTNLYDHSRLLSTSDSNYTGFLLYVSANGSMGFLVGTGSSWNPSLIAGAGTISENTWHHIAVVREGTGSNEFKLYVDGVMKSQTTYNSSIGDGGDVFIIGNWRLYDEYFYGYMDEIRISKGIARWTSNFTPPSSEYSSETDNMTLISDSAEAETQPDEVRIVIFEEDIDSVTINTDLKVYISRDDGNNYSQVTLVDEGDYESGKRILVGNVDISGQPSDKTMRWKIETLNNKNCKIHGVGLNWE